MVELADTTDFPLLFQRGYNYDKGNRIRSGSYPRILMEEKLGRPLKPEEDVHHIDGDVSNNQLDNLGIKVHGEHQSEHSRKYYDYGKCVLSGEQEQINRDIYAECGLNGETFPNGNTVPNT